MRAKTLHLRMKARGESALVIVKALQRSPHVEEVIYPIRTSAIGLTGPDKRLSGQIRAYQDLSGALVSDTSNRCVSPRKPPVRVSVRACFLHLPLTFEQTFRKQPASPGSPDKSLSGLSGRQDFAKVLMPGLTSHPLNDLVYRLLALRARKFVDEVDVRGEEGRFPYGGMISFRIRDGGEEAERFLTMTHLFTLTGRCREPRGVPCADDTREHSAGGAGVARDRR